MGWDSVEQPGNIADQYAVADDVIITVVYVCTDIDFH